MFAQKVILSADSLTALKLELTRRLPRVKSSHRCEALARALGFEKYASLLSVIGQAGNVSPCDVNAHAFVEYLISRGFEVPAVVLYRCAAVLELDRIKREYPLLTVWGFGAGQWKRDVNGIEESPTARRARFAAEREALTSEGSIAPFLTSMAMLSRVPMTKTVRPKAWSYWLKHIAENLETAFPDGSRLGPVYVPNGLFIAAALASGFHFRPATGVDGMDRNVVFNMPYGVLVEPDIEARPHGARAEARRRRQEERRLVSRWH